MDLRCAAGRCSRYSAARHGPKHPTQARARQKQNEHEIEERDGRDPAMIPPRRTKWAGADAGADSRADEG